MAAVLERVANATAPLVPGILAGLPLPLAPVGPIQAILQHLNSTPVHQTYFPFLQFSAMHAVRVAAAWVAMTRGRGRVSVLQDLLGFLTVAWGGGTIASLLLSTPPAWLISATPWAIYTAIYIALIPTGLAEFFVSTMPAIPLALALSAMDGMLRGSVASSIPNMLKSAAALNPGVAPVAASAFAPLLLSAIAANGGGWIVQTFGMNKAEWTPGRPSVLAGGLLATLEVWAAVLGTAVYGALTNSTAFAAANERIAPYVPHELRTAGKGHLVDSDTARAVAVLIIGCLFAARSITTVVLEWRSNSGTRHVRRETEVTITPATPKASPKPAKVIEEKEETAGKPRKRKSKSKSKSPGP